MNKRKREVSGPGAGFPWLKLKGLLSCFSQHTMLILPSEPFITAGYFVVSASYFSITWRRASQAQEQLYWTRSFLLLHFL